MFFFFFVQFIGQPLVAETTSRSTCRGQVCARSESWPVQVSDASSEAVHVTRDCECGNMVWNNPVPPGCGNPQETPEVFAVLASGDRLRGVCRRG